MKHTIRWTKTRLKAMTTWGDDYFAIKNKYAVIIFGVVGVAGWFIWNQIQANDERDRQRDAVAVQTSIYEGDLRTYENSHDAWELCQARVRNGPVIQQILININETIRTVSLAEGTPPEFMIAVNREIQRANQAVLDEYPLVDATECGSEPIPPPVPDGVTVVVVDEAVGEAMRQLQGDN